MKIEMFQVSLPAFALSIALSFGVQTAPAQEVTAVAPVLSYGVPQILQLSQANVGDDVIVRYVQNSGTIFPLAADEIVFLKQQGVSDAVLKAMLDQRQRLTGSTEPATAPPEVLVANAPGNPVLVQPINYNYYATAPSSMVYVMPDTQTRRYDRWYDGHPYPYRAGYGNGFYEWPYCYSSVAVVIGTSYRQGNYPIHEHIVLRH